MAYYTIFLSISQIKKEHASLSEKRTLLSKPNQVLNKNYLRAGAGIASGAFVSCLICSVTGL